MLACKVSPILSVVDPDPVGHRTFCQVRSGLSFRIRDQFQPFWHQTGINFANFYYMWYNLSFVTYSLLHTVSLEKLNIA
jgi:hypothetical protein